MIRIAKLIFLVLITVIPLPVLAIDRPNAQVTISFLEEPCLNKFGQYEVNLVSNITFDKGWHAYWKYSGDSGAPPSYLYSVPSQWTEYSQAWESPQIFIEDADIITYGFTDRLTVNHTFIFSEDFHLQDFWEDHIQLEVDMLLCKEGCVPVTLNLDKTVSSIFSSPKLPFNPGEPSTLVSSYEVASLSSVKGFPFGIRVRLTNDVNHASNMKIQIFPEVLGDTNGLAFGIPRYTQDGKDIVLPISQLPTKGTNLNLLVVKESPDGNTKIQNLNVSEVTPSAAPISDAANNLLEYRLHQNAAQNTDVGPNYSILAIFFLGFLGGLVLNFMPCVLPVIGLKAISLTKSGDSNSGIQKAISYSMGVITSIVILFSTTLLFSNHEAMWGTQFQSPLFLVVASFLIWVLALLNFGQISLPVSIKSNKSLTSFSDGIVTTILSTPCTAPFLGTVLVLSSTWPIFQRLLLAAVIGLGLAAPLSAILIFPGIKSKLPKPGEWMNTFKHMVGMILVLTCLWLTYVLHVNNQQGFIFILSLILFTNCIYLFSRRSKFSKVLASIMLILCFYGLKVSSSIGMDRAPITWRILDSDTIQNRDMTKPLFIKFTADWCVTCKVNEALVINTESVANKIRETQTVAVVADWTKRDKSIGKLLHEYGSSGVPFYLFFPKNSTNPIPLGPVISKSVIIEALETN